MTRPLALFASAIVVVALAAPSAVQAQAQRRGGSSSGTSSGGSSSGGASGGSVAVPREASPRPSPAPTTVRERPSQPASTGGGTTRTSGGRPAGGSDGRVAPAGRSVSQGTAAMRVRTTQPTRGVAQPRTNVISPAPQYPINPWGRWSPWYGYGYGYSYGYAPGYYGHVVYDPWIYGGSSIWTWNRYAWHDPFLYDPYGYAGYPPYYWSTDIYRDDDDAQDVPSGSLRLRVDPSHARVYVDGALAGVASEFGGLSNHLVLPAGVHEVEFRAEGYATFSAQVDVRAGRTRTERIKLEKQ
jgi:hypothetical protein